MKLKIKVCCVYTKSWHNRKELFWVICADDNELLYTQTIAIDMMNTNMKLIENGPANRYNPYFEHTFLVPLREDSGKYEVKVMAVNYVSADC